MYNELCIKIAGEFTKRGINIEGLVIGSRDKSDEDNGFDSVAGILQGLAANIAVRTDEQTGLDWWNSIVFFIAVASALHPNIGSMNYRKNMFVLEEDPSK
jgi:hypothetical protein